MSTNVGVRDLVAVATSLSDDTQAFSVNEAQRRLGIIDDEMTRLGVLAESQGYITCHSSPRWRLTLQRDLRTTPPGFRR